MGFKVILTPQSVNDLQEIVTFIAKDNPDRARTFGNELIDRALSVAAFPDEAASYRRLGIVGSVKSFMARIASFTRLSGINRQFTYCGFGTAQEANRN